MQKILSNTRYIQFPDSIKNDKYNGRRTIRYQR